MAFDMDLVTWRGRFHSLDVCPWPGPRPFDDDDEQPLRGRGDETIEFRRQVDGHKLVILTGRSGVGKTSLLRRGIVPGLRAEGYKPAVCRDWSGTKPAESAADFLARRVSEYLDDPEVPAEGVDTFFKLAEAYGDNALLVLDQFEELIRDDPEFQQQIFDVLVNINHYTPIKVVVSLRAEHLHELRSLEHRAKPFTISHYFLEEISSHEAIVDVIAAGNLVRPGSIDDDAVEAIAKEWESVRRTSGGGLLNLQALLYALHDASGGGAVTLATITAWKEADPDIFAAAIQRAVEVKLARCRSASEGLDPYLVEGAADVLRRSVQHLSSGGFKTVREARDFAEKTIGDEIEWLTAGMAHSRADEDAPESTRDGDIDEEQRDALFDVVVETILTADDGGARPGSFELLRSTALDFASAADGRQPGCRVPWIERLHVDSSPLAADAGEATSGAMLGSSPAAVFVEELRRFAFALEWLRTTSLIRLSSPGEGLMTVSLIHDQFGPALTKWSRDRAGGVAPAIYAITAPHGAEHIWPWEDDLLIGPEDGATIIPNLRWRGASVIGRLRRVSFVNCDFRGTIFLRGTVFEGVSFVNCLLDGAMFTECEVVGAPSPTPTSYSPNTLRFAMPDSSFAASVLDEYRPNGDAPDLVLAARPGLPARAAPQAVLADTEKVWAFEHERGGLVITGGRVSTLVMRNMQIGEGSRICVRHAAGAGFDVVEHRSSGSYEIAGSALRHVTFTSPPTEAEGGDRLDVLAVSSAMFQVWVGHDVNGTIHAENCMLVSVWNGSDDVTFTADVECTYHDLVNVDVAKQAKPLVPDERRRTLDEIDADGRVRRVAVSMDYRRHPSRVEQSVVRSLNT